MSAKRRKAKWQEDLAIHEFIDSTKISLPDLRHRIILHNSDLGVFLAQLAFPDRNDHKQIVSNHVKEDLGLVPSLNDWLNTATNQSSIKPRAVCHDKILDAACEKIKIDDEIHVKRIFEILLAAKNFCPPQSVFGISLLMNSFGPWLTRQIVGPPHIVAGKNGTEVIFDAAWVAEGIIVEHFGRIPCLSEVLSPFSGRVEN